MDGPPNELVSLWARLYDIRQATAEVSVVLRGRFKVTAGEGIREAVNNDMGLAVSSEWNFYPELRSGKVVEVLQDWALPLTNLSAVYPTGRLASAKARAFVSFVEQYMGAMKSVSPTGDAASAKSFERAAEQDTQRGPHTASVAGGVVHRGARSSAKGISSGNNESR